jgi:DEAD/DEAH box helicase domain-containing protein
MVGLQAATVSNKLVRKRKRKSQEEADQDAIDTSTTVPTKTQDGGNKPKRTPKAKSPAPSLYRRGSSTSVDTTIPWPEEITKLSQVHRALNLVYTFCCTRKHLATTFETIKTTVESHIARELSVQDVAKIKLLIPRAINFAYIDQDLLQVNLMGEQENSKNKRFEGYIPPEQKDNIQDKANKEVLLFEYIDGDLKRQVQHTKTGEPTKATRKLKDEDLKMPVYSQKQMMNLIEKRNNKFTSAVNAWLNECEAEGVNPVEKLDIECNLNAIRQQSQHSHPRKTKSLATKIYSRRAKDYPRDCLRDQDSRVVYWTNSPGRPPCL